MAGGGSQVRELDQTPTWAVAGVCAVIIIVSILLEKLLHRVGHVFTKRRQWALYEALEKIKAELMLLGFISLILTIGQSYVASICIPLKYANTMLPCNQKKTHEPPDGGEHHRRLLWSERRFLGGGGDAPKCKNGKEPLISLNGLHQLHIFIFFLAVFHVMYSAMTMMLGRLQIRGWKEWEKETLSNGYDFSSDPSRFRLTHETSFVRSHNSFWTKNPIFFYVGCFFRQFFRSVRKSDYLTMRHGFVSVHLAPGSKFNFQKYIKKSLEDDFKVVVGISPLLWASVVIFLLLNVSEWETLTLLASIPTVAILAVGTKLQAIITQMALEIQERHAVVQGIPLVQVTDSHFWFGWPDLVLYLIHFTLFQNAFQITYFLWIWYEYGIHSCFYENGHAWLFRVFVGVAVQFLCSYITLPLYALVTQMGSTMKRPIFDEQMRKALKKWHMKAVNKIEEHNRAKTLARSRGSSLRSSSVPVNTTGPSTRSSVAEAETTGQPTSTQERGSGRR
ncbi:Mlo-like protein [Thalictrum thalictroides]|uniref:MLO-like protein n=1 Tax=Thalictrum thalictroides TaxID=46969 RepID=A0A7J6X4Z5_THATH|nr:Mlo-like protein [Thalictrum thalictroides]